MSRAGRRGLLAGPLVTAGIVGIACVGLALRDPHTSGSYGWCPLHSLAGLWCPLCGGLRGTWDLLHGDLAGAWTMNPAWVVATPVVVALWFAWLWQAGRGRSMPARLRSTRAALTMVAVLVLFTVLRNLPWLSGYLAPH